MVTESVERLWTACNGLHFSLIVSWEVEAVEATAETFDSNYVLSPFHGCSN